MKTLFRRSNRARRKPARHAAYSGGQLGDGKFGRHRRHLYLERLESRLLLDIGGLTGIDIGPDPGTNPLPGDGYEDGDQWVVRGGGNDIWNTEDAFHFEHEYLPRTGDFDATVRLLSLENTNGWAKAAIMARADLTSNSVHAMCAGTPQNGSGQLQGRQDTAAGSFWEQRAAGPDVAQDGSAPVWLRLIRSADVFYALWASDDGGTPGQWWFPCEATLGNMPGTVYLGLAVTSHNAGAVAEARFDNFSVDTFTEFPPVPPMTVIPGPEGGAGYFGVTEVIHNGTIRNQTQATDSLLSSLLLSGAGTIIEYTAPWINIQDSGSSAHVAGDDRFRAVTEGFSDYGSVDDISLLAKGTINVPADGDYTFLVNSDDGFRLAIDGQYIGFFEAGRVPGDSLIPIYLTAGKHSLQLTYHETYGGAEVELLAAPGVKTAYDDAFRLVGDSAGGGLELVAPTSGLYVRQWSPRTYVNTASERVLEITFNRAPAEFTSDDVILTGPAGEVPTTVDLLGGTTYGIWYDPLPSGGQYTLTVHPEVHDSRGVAMDQNFNEVYGEPDDAFAFGFNVVTIPTQPPESGSTLKFDGLDEYIEIPDSPTLHSDRQLTVSGWFKADTLNRGWQNIVWKGNSPDCTTGCENREFGLWLGDSGSLNFHSAPVSMIGSGNLLLTTPTFAVPGRWYHFAAVIDADENYMRVYIDGELIAERTYDPSGIRDTTGPLMFGQNPGGDGNGRERFGGQLDEVSIWGMALTQEEIRENVHRSLTGVEAGLRAYYGFDSGVGQTLYDYSGHGNYGTLGGGVAEQQPQWVESTAPIFGTTLTHTITVTNTNDDGPGSLRQVIEAAHAVEGSSPISIEFNIPRADPGYNAATGAFVIDVASPLPKMARPNITIDGRTQTNFGGDTNPDGPEIVLDGSNAGSTHGLHIITGRVEIYGLNIRRFAIDGVNADGDDNVIAGNFIGTDETGTLDRGNGQSGVDLAAGSRRNRVGTDGDGTDDVSERNILSGNVTRGVSISAGSQDNLVAGNYIGTDVNGTKELGNHLQGIYVNRAWQNTIGGGPGMGNVISGNDDHGIFIQWVESTGNIIRGNYVGTDASGTLAVGNDGSGIRIAHGTYNVIGGTEPGAGNVISGNNGIGVWIVYQAAAGNVVQGNLIGTDESGKIDLGNGWSGVYIDNASYNVIGGLDSAAGNVISGNGGQGVSISRMDSVGNVVQGNFIGTNHTADTDLANGRQGVRIAHGATNNLIGGTEPGSGNVIVGNLSAGVEIEDGDTTGNVVQGNFIGTDAEGTVGLGNGAEGVLINGAPENVIGGTDPEAGNVISANAADGISIEGYQAPIYEWTANVGGNGHFYVICDEMNWEIAETLAVSLGGHLASINNQAEQAFLNTALFGNLDDPAESFWIGLTDKDSNGSFTWTSGEELDYSNWYPGEPTDWNSHDYGLLRSDGTWDNVSWNRWYRGVIELETRPGEDAFGKLGGAYGNIVQGNFIGTTAGGDASLGNGGHGVALSFASENTIGGTLAGSGNLISGNTGDGVSIQGPGIYHWPIGEGGNGHYYVTAAPMIWTDSEALAVSVGGHLASITSREEQDFIETRLMDDLGGDFWIGLTDEEIEGTFVWTSGEPLDYTNWGGGQPDDWQAGEDYVHIRNDKTWNDNDQNAHFHGLIELESSPDENLLAMLGSPSGTLIQGNSIGTDSSGTELLGNAGHGIYLASATDSTIGVLPGESAGGNVIGFNAADGIAVVGRHATGNRIQRNSIFSNGVLGIELGNDGTTPNDGFYDSDLGPNRLQNTPVIVWADVIDGDVVINYHVDSEPGQAAYNLTIDFYEADSAAGGEGEVYLGSHTFAPGDSSAGWAEVNLGDATTLNLADGDTIAATATDADGNTSEFSFTRLGRGPYPSDYGEAFALGDGGRDVGHAVAGDDEGNVYIAGEVEDLVDFDLGPGQLILPDNGLSDAFVAKYAFDGALVWARRMGGTSKDMATAIALTDDGSVLLAGRFRETVDFDPGPGTFPLTSMGSYDVFVCKLDPGGQFVWAVQLGGESLDRVEDIAIDGNGNILLAGSFRETVDFDPGPGVFELQSRGRYDAFVAKLDAAGNLAWAAAAGGDDDDFAQGIAVGPDGRAYVAGSFEDTADFDSGPGVVELTSPGGSDAFLARFAVDGTLDWARAIGGAHDETASDVALARDGSVYLSGHFEGTADMDPGPDTLDFTSVGFFDAFVSKLDAGGNLLWARQIGGDLDDEANAIAVDGQGSVYITGMFDGTTDFDPGDDTERFIADYQDVFISKLDAAGDFVWARRMGGPGAEIANAIAVGIGDSVCLTGEFDTTALEGGADFDPGPDEYKLSSNGSSDVFFVKLTRPPIGNRVWNDLDPNGIQDDGEPGIKDVDLELYAQITLDGWNYYFETIANTTTDARGLYWFENNVLFQPGDYRVRFELPHQYLYTLKDAGPDTFDSDADPETGLTDIFSLEYVGALTVDQDVGLMGDFPAAGLSMSFDSIGRDEARAVATDRAGNLVAVGRFTNEINFDPDFQSPDKSALYSNGGEDVFVVKYSSAGSLLWAHSFGGDGDDAAWDVAVDDALNVYVAGSFRDSVNFDTGEDDRTLFSAGGTDAFVLRLDKYGEFLWARGFGGSDTDTALAVALDSENNVHIAGSFQETADFDPSRETFYLDAAGGDDAFLCRLDSAGNFLSASSFGGEGDDRATGVGLDSMQYAYVTGEFHGTADFDPGPGVDNLSSEGGGDCFLVRLDRSDQLAWARSFGGPEDDAANGIAVNDLGDIHVVGAFRESVDFDPSVGVEYLSSAGGQDVFVAKFLPSGNLVWARGVGGVYDDWANDVTLNFLQNIYVTGAFRDTVDFDPSIGVYTLSSPDGGDLFSLKLDTEGDFRAATSSGGPFGDDEGFGIAYFPGVIYTGGVFSSVGGGAKNGSAAAAKDDEDVGIESEPDANTISDKVWNDENENGVQDADEWGLNNVLVELFTNTDQLKSSVSTYENGFYLFGPVPEGDYYVRFHKKTEYDYTLLNQGTDEHVDSDANPNDNGKTAVFTLLANEAITWQDAGLFHTGPNHVPETVNDSIQVDEDKSVDGDVLVNDNDADGDSLTVTLQVDVNNGNLVLAESGQFEYTPDDDFNGQDTFTYAASDGEDQSDPATVTITVNPINDEPEVENPIDDVTASEDDPDKDIDVDGVFSDADVSSKDSLTLSVQSSDSSLVGAVINGQTLTLDFQAKQNGVAQITVRATDSEGAWVEDEFDVNVRGVAEIVASHVFYDNSSYDDVGSGGTDDESIATDKQALLPGQTATFDNYTSYSRGINGLMIDIDDLEGTPTVADFQFKVGNDNAPGSWANAPAPTITLRPGAGDEGSNRLVIAWDDNDIQNQWLEVTVLGGGHVPLPSNEVFYFGNAIGESGNSAADAKVNALDALSARNNPHNLLNPASITSRHDHNRDGRVNATDMLLSRSNQTHFLSALKLITPPSKALPKASSPVKQGLSPGESNWLFDWQQIDSSDRCSKKARLAEEAIDELLRCIT